MKFICATLLCVCSAVSYADHFPMSVGGYSAENLYLGSGRTVSYTSSYPEVLNYGSFHFGGTVVLGDGPVMMNVQELLVDEGARIEFAGSKMSLLMHYAAPPVGMQNLSSLSQNFHCLNGGKLKYTENVSDHQYILSATCKVD